MPSHDTSFVRDGRPLRDWILELVSPDADVRKAAGDAVMAMVHALPSVHTDMAEITGKVDYDAHARAFHAAIQSAVGTADFPARPFFGAAATQLIGGHAQWMREITKSDEQYEAVLRRIGSRLDTLTSERKRQQELRRLGKAMCAEIKRVTDEEMPDLDAMSMANIVLPQIVEHAGEPLLQSPEAIWMLLENPSTRHFALTALEQIGPPAAPLFLDDLLDHVSRDPSPWSPELAAAIAVGRGSAKLQTRVMLTLERIRTATAQAASLPDLTPGQLNPDGPGFHEAYYHAGGMWAATAILARLGPVAREMPEVGPQLIPTLLDLSRAKLPGYRGAAASALGRAAQGGDSATLTQVVDRLLELTHDHLWVIGSAIQSLGVLAALPERVVPRLVELIDEFTDFDPDNFYHGDHYRVCTALQGYGPAARPAVPRLIRYLEAWLAQPALEREPPKDVLHLLIAIGPGAGEALPVLTRVAAALTDWYGSDEQPLTMQAIAAVSPG